MSKDLDPDEVTSILGVPPSKSQLKGHAVPDRPDKRFSRSGWFLSSKGKLESKDSRDHLDWILDRVHAKRAEFMTLHERGYLIDLCVRWDSLRGDGGPTLSPKQMHELAELDIELWFDVYLDSDALEQDEVTRL